MSWRWKKKSEKILEIFHSHFYSLLYFWYQNEWTIEIHAECKHWCNISYVFFFLFSDLKTRQRWKGKKMVFYPKNTFILCARRQHIFALTSIVLLVIDFFSLSISICFPVCVFVLLSFAEKQTAQYGVKHGEYPLWIF